MASQQDDITLLLQLAAQVDFAALVPESFQEYVPLLEEGLACFLDHLPPDRHWEMIASQAELSPSATMEQRMVQWMLSCPTLHKLGQLLARDQRLPQELRDELQLLESLEPKTDVAILRPVIESELGSLDDLGIELAGVALAEASVAVVVPFQSPDGPGVLKVLKPEIQLRLEQDLEAWDALAEFLDEHRVRLQLDHIDYRDTLQRVRELLCHEVNLTTEQNHLREAAQIYRNHSSVAIPALFPFCSSQVTAMEYLEGQHVTTAGPIAGAQLARTIIESLVVTPVFNTSSRALFHGDPHAGNLLVTPTGRLGVIDWGLAGHLTKVQRELVTQILVGCLTLDSPKICQALDALAVRVEDRAAMSTCVQGVLAEIARRPLGGMMCVMELLDAVVMGGHGVFEENLLLFRKLLHIVEGVVADIDPRCSLDQILLMAGCRQFGHEALLRPLADPFSRSFGTHLSNADIAEVICSGPLALLRRMKWMLSVE